MLLHRSVTFCRGKSSIDMWLVLIPFQNDGDILQSKYLTKIQNINNNKSPIDEIPMHSFPYTIKTQPVLSGFFLMYMFAFAGELNYTWQEDLCRFTGNGFTLSCAKSNGRRWMKRRRSETRKQVSLQLLIELRNANKAWWHHWVSW